MAETWRTPVYGAGSFSIGALRRGWSLLRRRGWQCLALTHVGLAAILVLYLLMVLFNSVSFSYSFWNEAAPSDAANLAAGLSLLVLAVLVVGVSYVVYGAYCVMFLGVDQPAPRSASSVLRRAFGSALRAAWWAPPFFLAAIFSIVLVVPAIFVLPVLAPLPFGVIQRWKPFWKGQMTFVRSHFDDLLGCSAITALGGVLIWSSLVLAFFLADNFDGLVEALAIPVVWGCYLGVAFLAALMAATTAVLSEEAPMGHVDVRTWFPSAQVGDEGSV